MRYYYTLQYKRFYRILKGLGLEPILVVPLCLFLFYWMSSFFFDKIAYADYSYSAVAVLVAVVLGFPKHNELIKAHFSRYIYRVVIISNHILIVLPFVIFLFYKGLYLHSLVVCFLAVVFSFFKKIASFSVVIPTPFFKKPYEFIVGFRSTFWVFVISYSLAIISVKVGNFNLGMFSIVSIFFICSGYYMKPDPEFYIWIHGMTPKEFLMHKIFIAARYSVLLALPSFLIISIFYFDQLHITLIFLMLGVIYIVLHILVRYAFNMSGGAFYQGIIGVLSIFFPPIMIIFLPYFYSKAIRNLNSILDDRD